MSEIYKHRNPLVNTINALKKGKLTIGFIGGSITDARGYHNWPEPVTAWFVEKFPDVRIVVENAAIGATGSDLAVFRAKRDLIDRGCDLVFVEFAANDYAVERVRRHRSREGLFRKLLSTGDIDVVAVYTYIQNMYEDMMAGKIPESIADYEVICEHYGIGSVWMSRYAFDEVLKGRMRWEEWLPDGLHPTERGSLSYASSVIQFLEIELKNWTEPTRKLPPLPPPLDPLNWERTEFIPFDRIKTVGPWYIRRSVELTWMDLVLETSAPGSKIIFDFEGRGLFIAFNFGKKSAEVRYSMDGGEKITTRFDRLYWVPDSGLFFLRNFGDDLENGIHHFEVETVHGNFDGCQGTRCAIAFIGEIR